MAMSKAERRAERQAKRGKRKAAIRLYSEILQQEPDNTRAREALRELGAAASARLAPADLQRVVRLLQGGNRDDARAEIDRLCAAHPQQPAPHNLRGIVLIRCKQPEQALLAFQRALVLEPGFPEALTNLASTLSRLDRHKEALGCYRQLVDQGNADAEVYAGLARALRADGQTDRALQALRRALKQTPLSADLHNELGKLLNAMGRHDEALRAYENALDIQPTHRLASLGLQRSKRLQDASPGQPQPAPPPPAPDAVEITPPGEITFEAVRRLFDELAEDYEARAGKNQRYLLPGRIPALLETIDGENAWYPRTYDLGCGTGLVGAQLRSYCEELIGIDISAAMLAKAAEKAVYDELVNAELSLALRAARGPADLIVSAEVLTYLGALEAHFADVAALCKQGTRYAFSIETSDADKPVLLPSARYAHSPAYVTRCAEAAGFTLLRCHEKPWKKEHGEPVPGVLLVFAFARES